MSFTSLLLIFVSIVICTAIFTDFTQSLKQKWFQFIHKLVNFLSSYDIVNKPLIISIDGNIGSGKSTFIKFLKQHLDHSMVEFAPEPVDVWTSIVDDKNKNLLQNFYEDKERWSYTFQNFAYITRLIELAKAKKSGKKIIITERSVLTDRNVFAKMLCDSGYMSNMEMTLYKHWYDNFDTDVTHTFYLKTSVDNCSSRIKKRARDAESTISKDYLSDLEKEHDNWLLNDPNATILDGNVDFVNNKEDFKNLLMNFNKCVEAL